MKVRFEVLGEKCEECGKPAKWRCNQVPDTYLTTLMNNMHYYCDRCVKEK